MRTRTLLVVLAFMTQLGFTQQTNGPATSNPPASPIPDGEAHFTPEQLNEYYLVYTNSDVRYLRELFGAYLRNETGTKDEFNLLKKWSSDYYRSKFVVFSRDESTFGGTFITIIFQDRPDKVFVAWVYPEGSARKLTLRGWDLGKFTDEDIKRIRVRYRELLEDKKHAM